MLAHLLSAPDLGDAFLRAVEAAHDIGSPQQFFVWLRLHLYRFVPHDLALTCVQHGAAGGGRRTQVLNCVSLPDEVQAELSDPASRFWMQLAEAWHRGGQQPGWLDLDEAGRGALAGLPVAAGLADAGFGRVLMHGLQSPARQHEDVLLAFLRCGGPDPTRDAAAERALALWMPYLHFALLRSDGGAPRRPSARLPEGSTAKPLTSRELQVLVAVREAKANAQIAVLLGISPLTVKNHLRSIQKKLGARNRAHAVAEAMSLRLIS
jgi:DNA-binding CsgD family transcriptional regulator